MPPGTNYNYGNTNYQLNWVQVIVPTYFAMYKTGDSNIMTTTLTATNTVLDTQYPYGFNPYPNTTDGPGVRTDLSQEIAASFSQKSEMWLMFQPANGQWVPLRETSWYCDGSTTNSGTNWTITSATWSTNPPDADTGTAYPAWTNNIATIPFQVTTN